ncbi:acyl-CoA dehydrogenase family protein [Pseudonocardia yunnanensis]|uniref:acyl-CoA dehydrogenase family protein n=1 Tax=Pseudonocardia yunnanensis TaxID=58107 RepID=UPI0031E1D237
MSPDGSGATLTAVAADVAAPVVARARERAADVDAGRADPRATVQLAGALGLLDAPLVRVIGLVEEVAGECLSTAFSLWAQRMVLTYLNAAARADAELVEGVGSGALAGCTAMAPALRDVAGIAPVPVVAVRTSTGLRLHGPIHWASQLYSDAVAVLPVRIGEDPVTAERAVVRIRLSDPGVQVAPAPPLLAMDATASSSVRLDGVAVGPDAVLSTDLAAFVAAVRPGFLLLQSAFCTGLAARCVTESATHVTGVNVALQPDHDEISARLSGVQQRLHRWAARPGDPDKAELLRLRLDAAAVAVAAARLEATLRGGAGYRSDSAVARRLREASFLPVQAPTEGQLRWELSRSA